MVSVQNQESANNISIVFFPFMAQGHMLPMLNIANLFSSFGVKCTIFTTPYNATFFQKPAKNNDNIHIHVVPFPTDTGLPSGVENASQITSSGMGPKFFEAVLGLRESFDQLLHDLKPDCAVTDMFLPWTVDVASKHSVPRIVFHGTNFFSRCVFDSMDRYKPLENLVGNEGDHFVVPGLPHEIKLLVSQIDQSKTTGRSKAELFDSIRESELKSYGVIVNSYYELEPEYVQHYRHVVGRKAWHIGPVSLCQNEMERDESLANWLDSKSSGSVVYVCFGSMGDLPAQQIRELALALEASGHPFIWVVRLMNAGENVLPDGFEERIKERGLVIKGWAPQIQILNHDSVGCFVTHCGWNSSLEAISAGKPLVTWPLFAEQFFNERLIVDILKIGVAVGVKAYERSVEDRKVIEADVVKNTINEVMDRGENAEARRQKAKKLGEMAKKAVQKGGSSYADICNFIQELKDRRNANE